MQRAFDLAKKGKGSVSPNPLVGCVIVHDERIIGEGWHQKYGEAHAEVNAVNSVKDQSLLKASIVYVTLEPCAHQGKTPPCADLLVKHGVKKVVICNRDPFEQVDGKGIEKLKTAGIEVEIGLLEKEGLELNKKFFTFYQKKRPYVILKWAQTSDGFVARENFDSKWISNASSRKLVHKWRAEEDAILVGKNTVKYDNPKLDVRDWEGSDPVRVFIDRNQELDLKGLHLMDGSISTICYNTKKSAKETIEFVKLSNQGFINDLLTDLGKRKVQSIIIEGGSAVLSTFISQGFWDEARVFIGNSEFGSGIMAPQIIGEQICEEKIDEDILKVIRPH